MRDEGTPILHLAVSETSGFMSPVARGLSTFSWWNVAQIGMRTILVASADPYGASANPWILRSGIATGKEAVSVQTMSRSRLLNDSTKTLSVGLSGRLKSTIDPVKLEPVADARAFVLGARQRADPSLIPSACPHAISHLHCQTFLDEVIDHDEAKVCCGGGLRASSRSQTLKSAD